jgi:hypothetical protein
MTRPIWIIAASASVLLTACAPKAVLPGDVVRDAAAAIEIARPLCAKAMPTGATGAGDATYADGVWYVEFRDSKGRIYGSSVTAADGKSDGCGEMVIIG